MRPPSLLLHLTPCFPLGFPTCILTCTQICLNFLFCNFGTSDYFSYVLFLHLRLAVYISKSFLSICVSYISAVCVSFSSSASPVFYTFRYVPQCPNSQQKASYTIIPLHVATVSMQFFPPLLFLIPV